MSEIHIGLLGTSPQILHLPATAAPLADPALTPRGAETREALEFSMRW